MKEELLKIIEKEKEMCEKGIRLPRVIFRNKGNKELNVFLIMGGREEIKEILSRALSFNIDLLIVVFEARYKEFDKEKFKEYKYGDLSKDKKAKDVVIIWGIEKGENYRVFNVYEDKINKLELINSFEKEEFDNVLGELSFFGYG